MAKNLILRPILTLLAKIWAPKIFFVGFTSMLDIVTSYHCMRFQGKRMTQTQENGEKPHFGPNLGSLGPNLGSQFPPPPQKKKNLAWSVTRNHGQL